MSEPNFQTEVVKVALRNMMLKKDWFDITSFDAISKVMGVRIEGQDYDCIRLLHCVHYNEMPKEVRISLFNKVMECFGQDPELIKMRDAIDGSKLVLPVMPEKMGIRRFLGF